MLVWLNGPFGVGKSSTAQRLVEDVPGLRLFDPEWVGYLLKDHLKDLVIDDFQDLAPWRALVPIFAEQLASFTGSTLVAVQTVLVEEYWNELRSGFANQGVDVVHVVLDIDESALRDRIEGDEIERDGAHWRLDHIAAFVEARPWLTKAAEIVVDTTNTSLEDVVGTIRARLASLGC